jgi:hypothetical protein
LGRRGFGVWGRGFRGCDFEHVVGDALVEFVHEQHRVVEQVADLDLAHEGFGVRGWGSGFGFKGSASKVQGPGFTV